MTTHSASYEREFEAGRKLGLHHIKLAMWIFIASEVMFFGGLISAFLHYKLNNPSVEAGLLSVILVGGNTFVLLTSSFTMVQSLAAMRRGDAGGLARYLALTILLGALFLTGQGYEFATLYSEGMTLQSSVFGSSFYTLTGFHGMHVLGGIVWGLRNLVKTRRGGYASGDSIGVEAFGLYWHFVDIVWIVLFSVIYLI